jgi:uncharacterized protein (DUF433 family)
MTNPIERITINPDQCSGGPCIRDTRIEIAVILDGLAEGMTEPEIMDHYPQVTRDDIHAPLAYATDLAYASAWKTGTCNEAEKAEMEVRPPAPIQKRNIRTKQFSK